MQQVSVTDVLECFQGDGNEFLTFISSKAEAEQAKWWSTLFNLLSNALLSGRRNTWFGSF